MNREDASIHRRAGLVQVTIPKKVCWEGCKNYNEKMDWCRKRHEKEPPGCQEHTVYVDYRRNSPNIMDSGRNRRKSKME